MSFVITEKNTFAIHFCKGDIIMEKPRTRRWVVCLPRWAVWGCGWISRWFYCPVIYYYICAYIQAVIASDRPISSHNPCSRRLLCWIAVIIFRNFLLLVKQYVIGWILRMKSNDRKSTSIIMANTSDLLMNCLKWARKTCWKSGCSSAIINMTMD